ncbi:MAG: 6-phosphogluconolactonase [Chromatiales bacterium]|nr:6-phosphogluconolactonase [Chromatiales bacterium]
MGEEVIVFDDVQALADAAAERVVGWLRSAIVERGEASMSLAGGGTPGRLYETLATRADADLWPHVSIYFGDERAVGPDDEDSNYLMAKRTLLSGLAEQPAAVHRIEGELGQDEAATRYAKIVPDRLDVVLLGMGEDGHTASLFPGRPELERGDSKAIPAFGPKPPPERISLTLGTLNAARNVAFLVTGSGKTEALAAVIAERNSPNPTLPSARVAPESAPVFFVDMAAAQALT